MKPNSFTIRNLWSNPLLQRLLGVAVFAGFVVFVEVYFGWALLLAPWQTLPAGQILAAVVLAFVSYWTRALRLYDYFRQDMRGAFGVCFKVTLQHNLLNNLLPMRAGEISFPLLMTRHFAVPVVRSVPALFWFRLLDLHTLGACALLASTGLLRAAAGVVALVLLLAWMTLPPLLFWGHHRWQRALQQKTPAGHLHGMLQKVLASLPQTPGDFWRAWAWTVLTWAVKLAVFGWVLMLFIDITPTAALMGVIAGDLTSVLPIHSVAGLGTYEAGVVAGLLPYRVPAGQALPAAVNLHLFLLGATLISGALSLLLGGKKNHG